MTRWQDPHGNTWTQLGTGAVMLNHATGQTVALTADNLNDWQRLDELDGQHTLFPDGDDAA